MDINEVDGTITKRPVSPKAEEILGKPFKVLDHGSIVLADYMGNDDAIAKAARVSNQKGTKAVNTTRGLVRYLVRHRHSTPIEHVEAVLHVRAPVFVNRQWFRHRTFTYNEESARYSEMRPVFYVPDTKDVCTQSKDNKQGRGVVLSPELQQKAQELIEDSSRASFEHYQELLAADVSRELSRTVLPVNLYSSFSAKANLKNWSHFVNLRADSHAQLEIRRYAEVVDHILSHVAPYAWEAIRDYEFGAVRFSRMEAEALAALISYRGEQDIADVLHDVVKDMELSKREIAELSEKIGNL